MASVDRIQGLSGQQAIKTPCRLATTANITLSGEQTIDGVAAVEGDRVLVKDQTTTTQNGVYDVSTGSWTRSLDFDGPNDIADGTMVLVNSGSTYADKVFKLNATEPITIGTTALTFTVATTFTDISAFAATLLDDTTAAEARATLGVAIGTNVQAYDADIPTVAASQVEMEAGTEAALRSMSPLRVAQAIAALVPASPSRVVQVVNASIATVVNCNSAIPVDDTIPQNTEGVEVLTCTITPTSASNRLLIDFDGVGGTSVGATAAVSALFQDSTASALAVGSIWEPNNYTVEAPSLSHEMAAGTTSATTFKVRIGVNSGSFYVNGDQAGNRVFGGVAAARIRITEILV